MNVAIADIETDSLDATVIHCIVVQPLWSRKKLVFTNLTEDQNEKTRFWLLCQNVDTWVFHNGIGFDVPTINRLLGDFIKPETVLDTLILSRLIDYNRQDGHSLRAWGIRLGLHKGDFKDFDTLSEEMVEYCANDVDVTHRLYKTFLPVINDPDWATAIETEHDIAWVCEEMTNTGFLFDKTPAEEMLSEMEQHMEELEQMFQQIWPPKLVEVNRVKFRMKKDGTLFSTVSSAINRYPKTERVAGELVCYDYKKFEPSSPKQRIERLWEAGWEPVEKTKGHIQYVREHRLDKDNHYEVYGWTCSETNLRTLPDTAPEGAKKLAEWLTLQGRKSSLVEWLGQCKDDSRIHGRFMHIGAWTGRMSHQAPNQANIPSAFHGTPKDPVEEIKAKYDGPMRKLWRVPEGKYLVGTDAEGIQLRILAHLMQSKDYVDAIVTGKKEDETDIHNVNRRALGFGHITRDMAKTFIYAFLLGAGNAKIAQILSVNMDVAKYAVNNFLESIDGLKDLKKQQIPYIARRGWFRGLDGRKVSVPSEHKALAGMLQNGESVVVKHWVLDWKARAEKENLPFKLIDIVHDEVQVEVDDMDSATRLVEIQKESMNRVRDKLDVFCPLAVSSDIGKNWYETH